MCLLFGPQGEGMAPDMLARDNLNYAIMGEVRASTSSPPGLYMTSLVNTDLFVFPVRCWRGKGTLALKRSVIDVDL